MPAHDLKPGALPKGIKPKCEKHSFSWRGGDLGGTGRHYRVAQDPQPPWPQPQEWDDEAAGAGSNSSMESTRMVSMVIC